MIQIRAYEPADRDGCLDLLRRGHDPGFSLERFVWLHEQGPAGPSQKVVCEAEGRIVGLYAVLKRPAVLDGRPIVAGRDVDPVVDPEARGQGLFTRMLDWMLAHAEGVDLFYNFANRVSAPGFYKRGWRRVDALEDHVAQLGFGRLLSREALLWAASRLARPRGGGWPVIELTPDEVRGLPEPLPVPRRRFAVRRTADFLDWRYLRSPLHDYRILARRDGDDLVDLLVIRADPPAGRVTVVDVAAYREDGGSCAAYLPHLQRLFGGCWVGAWSTVPPSWRRGFLRSPRARGLPLLARGQDLGPGDCFVTHGDVEAS